MAEQLLGKLDREYVITIVTSDGKSESFEKWFVELNPTLQSLLDDLGLEEDKLDVSIFPSDNILQQCLDYGNLKIIEKWSDHYRNLNPLDHCGDEDGEGDNERILSSLSRRDVMKDWHVSDNWEIEFIDKLIDIGSTQNPPYELFVKILTLCDYLGNQRFCHSLVDRWLIHLNSNKMIDPVALKSKLNIEGYDQFERDRRWKKYEYE